MIRSSINISGLIGGMDRMGAKLPSDIRTALGKVGLQRLDDVLNRDPKPPIKSGDLRGSGASMVEGGAEYQAKKGGAVREPSKAVTRYSVRVSMNTAYAARLETREDWSPVPKKFAPGEESRIGPHFLAKTMAYAPIYRADFAKYLAEEMFK